MSILEKWSQIQAYPYKMKVHSYYIVNNKNSSYSLYSGQTGSVGEDTSMNLLAMCGKVLSRAEMRCLKYKGAKLLCSLM